MLKVESKERAAKHNENENGVKSKLVADETTWHPSQTVQNRKTQIIHKPKLPAAALRYRREIVALLQPSVRSRRLEEPLGQLTTKEQNLNGSQISVAQSQSSADPHLPNPKAEKPAKLSRTSNKDTKLLTQMKQVHHSISRFLAPSMPQIAPSSPKSHPSPYTTLHQQAPLSLPPNPQEPLSMRHRSPHPSQPTLTSTATGYLLGPKFSNPSNQKPARSSDKPSPLLPDLKHRTLELRKTHLTQHPLADYFRNKIVRVSDYSDGESPLKPKGSQNGHHSLSRAGAENTNNSLEINLKLLASEEVRTKMQEALASLIGLFQKFGITELSGITTIQLLLNFDGSVSKSTLGSMPKSDVKTTSSTPTIQQISSPRYMASKACHSSGQFIYMERSFSVKCFAEGYLRHTIASDKSFSLFSLNTSYYRLHIKKIAKFLEKILSTYKLVELRSSTNLSLCYKLAEEKKTYKRLLNSAFERLGLAVPSDLDEQSRSEMNHPFPDQTWALDSLESKMVDYLFYHYTPEFVGPEFENNKQQTKRLLEIKIRSLVYPKGIDPADFLELQEVIKSGEHEGVSHKSSEKQAAKAFERRLGSLIMHQEKPQDSSKRQFDVLKPSLGDFRSDWSAVLDQCANKDVLALKDTEFDEIFGELKEIQSAKKLKEMKAINVRIPDEELKPLSRVKELLIYQRETGRFNNKNLRKVKEDSEQT